MAYDDEVLVDSPIAYWKLDSLVPPSFPVPNFELIDTANARNGTLFPSETLPGGVLVQGITGPILTDPSSVGTTATGNPIAFVPNPGSPDAALDLFGPFTWEAWAIKAGSGTETVFNRGGDASTVYLSYGQRSTGLFPDSAYWVLSWDDDAEGRELISCTLADGWHHLVMTYDGVDTMIMYVDGWLITSRSDCPPAPITPQQDAFRLGYMSNFAFGAVFISPGLANMAVYDYVLPHSRVEAHTVAALGALPESPCEGATSTSASFSLSHSGSSSPSSSASASPAPCTPPEGRAVSCINARGRLFLTLINDDNTQNAYAWHEGAERMPISSMTNWKPSMRPLTLQELDIAFETDNADGDNPLVVSVHRNLRRVYVRDARVTAGSDRVDSLTAEFDTDNIGDCLAVFGHNIGGPNVHYILGRIVALASPSASPSPSSSPSASPSTTESASPSGSPSASPSSSRSGSPSPSHSPSASPSASPSRSGSASPSVTPSASPSASPSLSPSTSVSSSPSAS